MKWLLTVTFISISFASEFNLRVESNLDGLKEQQAVVDLGEQLLLSRNSNFFCDPSQVVVLGKFEIPKNRIIGEGMELIQLQSKTLPVEANTEEKEGTYHFAQQRFVPDDHFLAPNSSLVQKELCEIFEQVPQDLKLPDLVMVKIKGDQLEVYQPGLDQTKKYSVKENCQKHSEYTRCKVPGWGAANLLSQISDKSQSQ